MLKQTARNAIPATPARFMHRFSCMCIEWARPRPIWPEWRKAVNDFACRSMHAMHARLFTKRLARKRAPERRSTDIKMPLVVQRPWVINEPGEMLSRNGRASDVLLPVPVVLPVRFPAVAVR